MGGSTRTGATSGRSPCAVQSHDDAGGSDQLARLSVALGPYWLERSSWTECRNWLAAAAQRPDLEDRLRASVLNLRCHLEMWAGEPTMVPGLTAEALELVDGLDAPREHGQALGFRAVAIAAVFGPDAASPTWIERWNCSDPPATAGPWPCSSPSSHTPGFSTPSRTAIRPGWTKPCLWLEPAVIVAPSAWPSRWRLLDAISQGRIEDGSRLAESAAIAARDANHEGVLILALNAVAWIDLVRGDLDRCRATAAESVQLARQAEEDPAWTGTALWVQASADLAAGAYAQAVRTLEEARTLTANHRTWAALPMLGLADAAVHSGDAGRRRGHARRGRAGLGVDRFGMGGGRVRLIRAWSTEDPARTETLVSEALERSTRPATGLRSLRASSSWPPWRRRGQTTPSPSGCGPRCLRPGPTSIVRANPATTAPTGKR